MKKPKTLSKTRLLITSIFTLHNLELVIVGSLLLLGWIYLLRLNFIDLTNQLFVALAQAFKAGQLNLLGNPDMVDLVYFEGKIFTPHPPLPGLILVPIVYLFKNFGNQGYLFPIINLVNFFLFFSILKTVKTLKTNDVLWLCLAFFLASPYLFVGAFALTFNGLLAVTFLLLTISEQRTHARPLVCGSCLALAALCRSNLFFLALYFLLDLYLKRESVKNFLRKTCLFVLPLLVAVATIAIYNFARFGNPLQFGYSFLAIDYPTSGMVEKYGFFSPHYLWNNYYEFFIHPPQINLQSFKVSVAESGVGIIFASSYLLWLLKSKTQELEDRLLWLAVLIALIPLSLWFSSGGSQFSFRFALDFLPFIFILLARSFKKGLPLSFKGIILASVFWDWFLLYQYVLNLLG